MATREELMSLGMSAALARAVGGTAQVNVVPAGSNQAGATAIIASATVLTTAAAGGAMLPPSSARADHVVYNASGNAQTIYASGSEQINAIAAASGLSLANGKAALFVATGQGWIAILSA